MTLESLWGEEFNVVKEKEKTKKTLNKISKPKEVKQNTEKLVKSKKISLNERLELIKNEVERVLGNQKNNLLCIKDKETLHNYITKSIENGRIDIDTETNNSLDPITCTLMGACIYTPNEKQAYIPLNHRDPETKERFNWQLTEKDIKEEFQRLIDNNTFIIMHNGKFDYKVIKCTCDIELPIHWDTMIAAKLIDENEFSAGLKQQYISKIDPEQEKYSIEHLFEGVEYADIDPDLFTYYAATDAFMTDKLYLYQKPILESKDYEKIYKLFTEVEMPCVIVTAEMELRGVCLDKEYANRLQLKYHKKLDRLDEQIASKLAELKPTIEAWKLTPDASTAQNKKQTQKQYEKAKQGSGFDPTLWTNKKGEWYKLGKSKLNQLDEELTPDSLASPQQLGIILYDILKCPFVNKEKPYATGEEELNKLKDKEPLCDLMLKRRELAKLINSFIDALPEKINVDGRIHGSFNQYGTGTGRYSSSEPNLQQIPSHNKEIRMMFCADVKYKDVESENDENNEFIISHIEDLETKKGWKNIKNIKVNDFVKLSDDNFYKIKDIIKLNENNFKVIF